MLVIDSVSKEFASTIALKDISLSIEKASTHVLLGSSGSGKSTLIRLILGLISAEKGQITLEGDSVAQTNLRVWRQKIGYVPQGGQLFPHLTAKKNVTLVAETLAWSSEKIEHRINELAPLMSIDSSLLDRFPKELSGGQIQRFALMRAAFLNPQLLLLDEPLGALDPIVRADIQKELKDIFQRLGKTVLLVTHDIREAEFFADQLTLLHEGRLIQTGSFHEFVQKPADPFVTRFFKAQSSTSLAVAVSSDT